MLAEGLVDVYTLRPGLPTAEGVRGRAKLLRPRGQRILSSI